MMAGNREDATPRHSREGGNPSLHDTPTFQNPWIPAFAGMTGHIGDRRTNSSSGAADSHFLSETPRLLLCFANLRCGRDA